MKKMGFIFFNFDSVEKETGLIEIQKFVAFKTNEELKVLSNFEKEIDVKNLQASMYELLSLFEKWVGNPYENKFVTFRSQDMKDFTEVCKSVHYKSKTRDFHKIISYQYWNIQNEIMYRMGLKKQDLSLAQLLSIYGISFVGNLSSAKDMCYNTYTLAYHFKCDSKRNIEVFSNYQSGKKDLELSKTDIPFLDLKPIRSTGEQLLKQKVEEGWQIIIECKQNQHHFGIFYQATATHQDSSLELTPEKKEAIGQSLEACITNLFNS